MPLLVFDMIEGRTEEEVVKILDVVHEAVVEALEVPQRDRYQVVNQHKAYEMSIQDTGLGIERTEAFILLSIVSNKRTYAKKEKLYRLIAERLEEQVGLAKTDLMMNITENSNEDWSFANGEAQFMTGEL